MRNASLGPNNSQITSLFDYLVGPVLFHPMVFYVTGTNKSFSPVGFVFTKLLCGVVNN